MSCYMGEVLVKSLKVLFLMRFRRDIKQSAVGFMLLIRAPLY